MIGTIHTLDLHMHTQFSDGTNSPASLLDDVRKAGLDLFSVTDHDAVKACTLIRPLLTKSDPLFLSGVEFSCKDRRGKYHILGYRYDADSEAIRDLIYIGHEMRMVKAQRRLDFLDKKFGFRFSEKDREAFLSLDNPGKPHLANLCVRYGYALTKESAIKDYINQLQLNDVFLPPQEAIDGILRAGGIPVLAHPSLGSGEEYITGDEMKERLERLLSYGLQGLEAYYPVFTEAMREEILSLAETYRLYVTAGSDYHGKNKPNRLGGHGLTDLSEAPEGMKRFLEDALSG